MIKKLYSWEIELKDGTVENKKNDFNFDDVVRVSFIPNTTVLPRHDIIISEFKFKKRFARAFLGLDGIVKEYLHCLVTDKFRVYVKSSTGQCLITPPDHELYL